MDGMLHETAVGRRVPVARCPLRADTPERGAGGD